MTSTTEVPWKILMMKTCVPGKLKINRNFLRFVPDRNEHYCKYYLICAVEEIENEKACHMSKMLIITINPLEGGDERKR